MKPRRSAHIACLAAGALLFAVVHTGVVHAEHISGVYYPAHGDVYYNGKFFADSYFYWEFPIGARHGNTGYEHDIKVFHPGPFTSCRAWSDLPSQYDDCATAGFDEPPDGGVFSFGAFRLSELWAPRVYYGKWEFRGSIVIINGQPQPERFAVDLLGQEVEKYFCSALLHKSHRRREQML